MSRATRDLRRARQALAATIAALVEPGERTITRGPGQLAKVPTEPLLSQLRDAVAGSLHVGQGGRRGVPIPIDPGAVDLLDAIRRQAAAMHVRVATRSELAAEQRLHAIRELTASWTDVDQLTAVREQVQLWVDSIRAHLEPATLTPLGKACPHCRARMALVYDRSIREYVQDHALVIDHTDGICHCRACGSAWPWEFAAKFIAQVEREDAIREHYRQKLEAFRVYAERHAASRAAAQLASVDHA